MNHNKTGCKDIIWLMVKYRKNQLAVVRKVWIFKFH